MAANWRAMNQIAPEIAEQEGAEPASLVAIASVIAAMGLIAVGNGLLFAYIPVRLNADGFPPIWAGVILTMLSAGGMAGCLLTGLIVRRVGHARAFMTVGALIILSNVAIAAGIYPLIWTAARTLYGFAICSMFIVAQSWLNDAVENHIRGRIMAAFYVTYEVGLGVGAFLLRFMDLGTDIAPVAGIAFATLALLPVGMTRLPPPPPPKSASVAFRRAWSISPVGVAGMLAVGGLSMMVSGFTPIHAAAIGYSQGDVALLLFAMPVGTLLFQIPFGWISDRTDRRYIIITASSLVVVAGLAASRFDGSALPLMMLIYVVWSGSTESIYSLSSAHANDRADKGDLVLLASTMLFAWSLSGFVVPAAATALTAAYGTGAFMWVAVAIAIVFCLFVGWRIARQRPVPAAESGSFSPLAAQAPLPVELAFAPAEESGEGAGKAEREIGTGAS
jgi:MFS family permease